MGNRILAAIAIVFVGVAFALTCAVVFLTFGKSAFWVDKKLKIGGMLLTLSSIIAGSSGCGVFQPTCYDTARPPEAMCYDMPVEQYTFSLVSIKNEENLILRGEKNGPEGKFNYKLVLEKDTVLSGSLDIDSTGNFTIDYGKKAAVGEYHLSIEEAEGYVTTISFKIKDDTK